MKKKLEEIAVKIKEFQFRVNFACDRLLFMSF